MKFEPTKLFVPYITFETHSELIAINQFVNSMQKFQLHLYDGMFVAQAI